MQTEETMFKNYFNCFFPSPDEALEGCTLRVDAQRHSFALLVLSDETVDKL